MQNKRCPALFRIAGLWTLALCLATTVSAVDEPFKIQWPEGWEVQRSPGPEIPGKVVGDIRATPPGGALASLEFSYFPRQEGSKADLERDLGTTIQSLKKILENQGMTVTVSPSKAGTLGGQPSREAEISATGQGVSLRIWSASAASPGYLYTFAFKCIGDLCERHRGAFEATRSGLVLQ